MEHKHTASLFTRSANGLQAWPQDRTAIGIPARCTVIVGSHPATGDSAIQVLMGDKRDDLALYIPRGGSVVIEAQTEEWIPARVGCYWSNGDYTIGTYTSGRSGRYEFPESGYELLKSRHVIGRYATLDEAKAAAQSGIAPFSSPSSAKSWGLFTTDGPYSFLAEEQGTVKRFTFAPDGPAWSLKEVTHER